MDETARNIWLEKRPQHLSAQDFRFDRITTRGPLVVYERLAPESFIILRNTSKGFSLVGYSFNNLFFEGMKDQVSQTRFLEALEKVGERDLWLLKGTRSLAGPLGPLIRSQWGQGEFFNYYCPRDPRGQNGRVYVGCVAVAMGQIIRYYGGFNSFNFRYGFNSGMYGYLEAKLGSYDWGAMEDSPISVSLEVSDFLSDLGILLHMTYGPSGSSANSHQTLDAFHQLGYINGVIMRKPKFSVESWTEIFYQNLSEYKPVLVTGGGHAFVCDGYSLDGMFHFNMGWDGYGDGYYPLSCVMTLPVNEAFTELQPVSWPLPPRSVSLLERNRQKFVTWQYDQGQNPMRSKVYADDQLFLETTDTAFNCRQLSPGIHQIYVSALYADGESRWIGPVEVFVAGAPLAITDPYLYQEIQKELGHGLSDTEILQVYEGDLSRITSLNIDQPVSSMEGLGLCNHLKRLIIHGFPGLALDAGPLENLSELKILEWTGRPMVHPEALGKMSQLTELRIRQTSLESIDFLKGCGNLMKFEYSGAPWPAQDAIAGLTLLDDLVINHANLTDAGFISRMPQLIRLNLEGNRLTETGFLSKLQALQRANLSDNLLAGLLLTDQLQSLHELNVSGNAISSVQITAELRLLGHIDLSGNRLATPGRLFLYTPALTELNLANNGLRDMGKQRCANLESLDVSDNQLITTDWISLQPRLKRLNLEHNRISDLSGLTRNNLFRQLSFLGLDRNPLSKQAYAECLPVLVEAIDSVSKPKEYEPLSPCYLSPAKGSHLDGPTLDFNWFTDPSPEKCVYDLFLVDGDSLVPLMVGLDTCSVRLSQRPAAAFSWLVASRTADSVYFSGVNEVTSSEQWTVPFTDGFERYREGETLARQSDLWLVSGDSTASDTRSRITSSGSRNGSYSLELVGGETAVLSASHLDLPYIQIRFSAWIPPGQHGEFRIRNMNGMYLKLVWDESDIGKFYINDLIYCTFVVDHLNWTDYEVLAHARNNNFHVKAGQQFLINYTWQVPEGMICTESIEFSGKSDEAGSEGLPNSLYIDEVNISSAASTSSEETALKEDGRFRVYPNPFEEGINIYSSRAGGFHLSIFDINGKQVYRQKVDATAGPVYIPLSGLSPGIYTILTDSPEFGPYRIVRTGDP
jgi:hypothetical protein